MLKTKNGINFSAAVGFQCLSAFPFYSIVMVIVCVGDKKMQKARRMKCGITLTTPKPV